MNVPLVCDARRRSLVGYYRVNCPRCSSVKIDVIKGDWRPTTPEGERLRRQREAEDNSPQKQLENAEFKVRNDEARKSWVTCDYGISTSSQLRHDF